MARPYSELTKLILSLPTDMPVAAVIARAKAKGLSTSAGNVHDVRSKYGARGPSLARSAKPARAKSHRGTQKTKTRAAQSRGAVSSFSRQAAGQELRRLVLELGVSRAHALVDELTKRIATLVVD